EAEPGGAAADERRELGEPDLDAIEGRVLGGGDDPEGDPEQCERDERNGDEQAILHAAASLVRWAMMFAASLAPSRVRSMGRSARNSGSMSAYTSISGGRCSALLEKVLTAFFAVYGPR